MARTYVADLAGGTATVTIQVQQSQTFKNLFVSITNAAAGKVELSLAPTSQIGTAQPTSDVLARVNCSATAGPSQNVLIPIQPTKMSPFESIYIHQTGAGNLGSIVLY